MTNPSECTGTLEIVNLFVHGVNVWPRPFIVVCDECNQVVKGIDYVHPEVSDGLR